MEEKTSVWKKIGRFISKIPSIIKYAILILIVAMVVYLMLAKSNFTTHSKVTEFGLKNVGEIVTQTCYVTVVQDSKVDRDFFKLFSIPFTESRMIFSYDFEVDASLDFGKIEITKFDDKNKKVEISLPHAKFYKTTMNLDSLEVYLDSESLFSRIHLSEVNEAEKEMAQKAQNIAIRNNYLELADKNAEKLITGLIKSEGKYKDYQIIYNYQ